MVISATLVKALRERTGSGMMECKRALEATRGDIEAAVEKMRKEGMAKADKKAGRVAAEGVVLVRIAGDGRTGLIIEINCETDFVAKDGNFQAFCQDVADAALQFRPADVDALQTLRLGGGGTVDERRRALVAKIGENISVRRFAFIDADGVALGSYVHGGRIGVLTAVRGRAELARDIAMHVAASNPSYISNTDVPDDVKAKEREIIAAQTADTRKPADIIAKMVEGKLRKFLNEVTLLGQPFVKNPDITVEKLLQGEGATVIAYRRYAVGEGIERQTGDFAAEVAAAAQAVK